jgi:hypothetical protein
MRKNTINHARLFERKVHYAMTSLREKLWFEEDINNIKTKLSQCETSPLTESQKKGIKDYWKKLTGKSIPTYWHEYFYSRNGEFSVRYVPTCLYHSSIIFHLNARPLTMAYTDKNSYDNYLQDVWRPKTIIRNINGYFYDDKQPITRAEALEKCSNLKDVVIKPSMIGKWGTGVRIIDTANGMVSAKESVEDLFIKYDKNYIIQKKVIQHEHMSRLNPSSLNTLRVLSYRQGDEVFIMYAVVRIGRKDKIVDNETAGGMNADINLENGCIKDCAYGTAAEKQILKTDMGTELKGFRIPSFEQVIAIVKELHLRLPYFHLVGWDFGVDSEGKPVMIEWNRCPDLSQTAHGPAFGDMTEEVVKFALSQPDYFDARMWIG